MTDKKQFAIFFYREKEEIYILPEISKITDKKAYIFRWLSLRILAASITVKRFK